MTDPAFVLDAARLRQMVFDGGAALHKIRLEGTGRLLEDKGIWTWELCGSGQRLPARVDAALAKEKGQERAVTAEAEIPKGEAPFEISVTILEARPLP